MSDGAVDSMLGIVPVVVTGGVLLKFMQAAFPNQQRQQRSGKGAVRSSKKSIYDRSNSEAFLGDFSNIGFGGKY